MTHKAKIFSSRKMKSSLLALIIFISCQLTDVSFFGVKIGEIIFLSILFFVFYKGVEKRIFLQINAILLLLFLVSLFKSMTLDFYVPISVDSYFKQPYYISAARYIELFVCSISLIFILQSSKSLLEIINKFLFLNAVIVILFIGAYILTFLGINIGLTHENSSRVHGFYVEGGPLGLYYSALLAMTLTFRQMPIFRDSQKKFKIYSFFYLAVIFISQSKAGVILLITFYGFAFFKKKSFSTKIKTILIYFLLIISAYFMYGHLFSDYIENIYDIETAMIGRESDPSLVMGRVSAAQIGPKMIVDNPLFGIGLGNYSLMRNNPKYRGSLPWIEEWDLTGLGILTILIEFGIIGSLIFIYPFYKIYASLHSSQAREIFLIPILCFFLGVQVYFIYPWIFIGFAVCISRIQLTAGSHYDYK